MMEKIGMDKMKKDQGTQYKGTVAETARKQSSQRGARQSRSKQVRDRYDTCQKRNLAEGKAKDQTRKGRQRRNTNTREKQKNQGDSGKHRTETDNRQA